MWAAVAMPIAVAYATKKGYLGGRAAASWPRAPAPAQSLQQLEALFPEVPLYKPSTRDMLVSALPDVPTTRLTPVVLNEYGTHINPFGAKLILASTSSNPAVARACTYFNRFWTLMAEATATEKTKTFVNDYRRFFKRFCDVNREGSARYGSSVWGAGQRAFALLLLSITVINHPRYNEELLAREMYARYILAATGTCNSQTVRDGREAYVVYVNNTYATKQPNPAGIKYIEFKSAPGEPKVLFTFENGRVIKHVDRIWQGIAYKPCAAVRYLYAQRRCASVVNTIWQDASMEITHITKGGQRRLQLRVPCTCSQCEK